MVERPELGNHVTTLKGDLSEMIQALSAKLSSDQSEREIESVIESEVSKVLYKYNAGGEISPNDFFQTNLAILVLWVILGQNFFSYQMKNAWAFEMTS